MVSSPRIDPGHPLVVRRDIIYPGWTPNEFDPNCPIEQSGVKKEQHSVMLDVYLLLTLLHYRFPQDESSTPDPDVISSNLKTYGYLITNSPNQSEFRKELRAKIPCVERFLKYANRKELNLNQKTRFTLLTEGAATKRVISMVAEFLGSTLDDLVWKEDRPIFWHHEGAWAVRRAFIRSLTAGGFLYPQTKGENILPQLEELAQEEVNAGRIQRLEPSFSLAVQKWADEGFIELDKSDTKNTKAWVVRVSNTMLDSAIKMRRLVLQCELERRIEWLQREADPVQVRQFFSGWAGRINALESELVFGKRSRETRHEIYMWIALFERDTVRSVLNKGAQFFLRWRSFLKIKTGASAIATPSVYKARMTRYNQEKLDIHRDLYKVVEQCVTEGISIDHLKPVLDRDATLIRNVAAEADEIQSELTKAPLRKKGG